MMRARLFGLVFTDFDAPFTGAGRWLVGLVLVWPTGEITYRELEVGDWLACPMNSVPVDALQQLHAYFDPGWRS